MSKADKATHAVDKTYSSGRIDLGSMTLVVRELSDLSTNQIGKLHRVAKALGVEYAEVWARANLCTRSGQVFRMLGGCKAVNQ